MNHGRRGQRLQSELPKAHARVRELPQSNRISGGRKILDDDVGAPGIEEPRRRVGRVHGGNPPTVVQTGTHDEHTGCGGAPAHESHSNNGSDRDAIQWIIHQTIGCRRIDEVRG